MILMLGGRLAARFLFQKGGDLCQGMGAGIEHGDGFFVRGIQIRDHYGDASCPVGGFNARRGILQCQASFRGKGQCCGTRQINIRL